MVIQASFIGDKYKTEMKKKLYKWKKIAITYDEMIS